MKKFWEKKTDNKTYYIIGALVLVAVVAGAYAFSGGEWFQGAISKLSFKDTSTVTKFSPNKIMPIGVQTTVDEMTITSTDNSYLSAQTVPATLTVTESPATSPMVRELTVKTNPHSFASNGYVQFIYRLDGFSEKNGTIYANIYRNDGSFVYEFPVMNNVGNHSGTLYWDGIKVPNSSPVVRWDAGTYTFQMYGSAGGKSIQAKKVEFKIVSP